MKVLRLLIVDDEAVILRGLQETYDWESMGYEVVGTALDGEEALPMIDTLRPDVIMTDIKMRRMDGLKLMEQVKESHPDISFVILSAYKDFEYAKQAIRNGALSYLVKPIDDKELEKNMHDVYEKCSNRLHEKKVFASWKKLLFQDKDNFLHIMTERFLKNTSSESEIQNIYRELGADYLLDGYYLCICADMEYSYQVINQEDYVGKRHIMGKLLFDALQRKGKTQLFYNDDGSFVYVVRTDEMTDTIPFKKIMWMIQQELGVEIVSAISNCRHGAEGMKQCYMEANKLYGIACEAGASALTASISNIEETPTIYSIDVENKILQAIREANKEKLRQEFSRFVYQLDEVHGKIFLHRLMVRVEYLLQETGSLTKENSVSFANFYRMLYRFSVVRNVEISYKLLQEIVEEKSSIVSELSENVFREYIEQSLAYIDGHLADENLSVAEVAEEIHLNSAYFGRIFKAVMNESFKKYVLKRRIELAKTLLSENRYNVTAVGKMVGIPNSSYFCKQFKSVTGEQPSTYTGKEKNE